MSKQFIKAFAALDAFAASGDMARTTLCAALIDAGITTREEAEPIVTDWAARRTGCLPLLEGQKIAKGRKVLDSKHAAYENAKTTRRRAMDAFAPAEKPARKVEPKKESLPLTKAEIAALKAAIVACGGNTARAVAGLKALSA